MLGGLWKEGFAISGVAEFNRVGYYGERFGVRNFQVFVG